MSAAAEEVPGYRLFNNEQGAARISGGTQVVRPSTLGRLARRHLVPHTRIGRKVFWTEEQLAGAVAYLATEGRATPTPPSTKTTPAATAEPAQRRRGAIAPLESRPGRRYGRTP